MLRCVFSNALCVFVQPGVWRQEPWPEHPYESIDAYQLAEDGAEAWEIQPLLSKMRIDLPIPPPKPALLALEGAPSGSPMMDALKDAIENPAVSVVRIVVTPLDFKIEVA